MRVMKEDLIRPNHPPDFNSPSTGVITYDEPCPKGLLVRKPDKVRFMEGAVEEQDNKVSSSSVSIVDSIVKPHPEAKALIPAASPISFQHAENVSFQPCVTG